MELKLMMDKAFFRIFLLASKVTSTGDKTALDGTFKNLESMINDLNAKITSITLVGAALALTISIALSKLSKKEGVVSSAEEWTKRIIFGCIGIVIVTNIINYIVGFVVG